MLPGGLEVDRTWMVVDGDGTMVTARQAHALFRIVADTPSTDPSLERGLRLHADTLPDLLLGEPEPRGERVATRVSGQQVDGVLAGRDADAWLRDVLDRGDVRLVWCDDPTRRRPDPAYSRPGDHTSFADGYPVVIASLASLRRLDEWIAEAAADRGEDPPRPLSKDRFRPNARCVMTTLDPGSLETGKEPLRILARHRPVDREVLSAVNPIRTLPVGSTSATRSRSTETAARTTSRRGVASRGARRDSPAQQPGATLAAAGPCRPVAGPTLGDGP